VAAEENVTKLEGRIQGKINLGLILCGTATCKLVRQEVPDILLTATMKEQVEK
jgi:hypothetical protein